MSLVVIVDDRITNRNIFARLAASIEEGVTVEAFGDPATALAWMETHQPDLIITDYKMPDLDGAEFIRRLRLIPAIVDVPVVVITVYDERPFRLRALEAGATDFLHSPVDHHEFVTRARNLLKMRRQQIELATRAVSLERELKSSVLSRETVLRDSSERLAQVIDTLPAMICATGPDGGLLFVNAYQTRFNGLDGQLAGSVKTSAMFDKDHWDKSTELDKVVFETARALESYEQELTDATGAKRTFLTVKAPLKSLDGSVTGVLTSSMDITARKRVEAHLRHLAHHDQLTNLPNRTLLGRRLRSNIAHARRSDKHFALHVIDLDHFKRVNDLMGHAAGDQLLRMISERLGSTMRESDMIARLGGDEFAVLQTDVGSAEEAAQFAQRILEVIGAVKITGSDSIDAAASVGIAVYPADGGDSESLLKHADLAMYKAKGDGGNQFCFYSADLQAKARQEATLDGELREAIARQQFVLHYQPQIDLASGRIIGAEALIRWNRPGHGLVSPGVFLGRTEENGLIIPINEWVLRAACAEAKGWARAGFGHLRVSVNMSPIQFRNRAVPLLVARILGETGLDPRQLDLELTEGIMVHDIDAVASDLKQVLRLGTKISIDDFGTGFSSLGYIKKFPVDRIKIDQSFIRNLATDPNDLAIVRTIITLGRSLNLIVVAEGVETIEQARCLREEGCNEVQGYFFGRPMPAADFLALAGKNLLLAKTA